MIAVALAAALSFVAFATASPAQAVRDDFYMGVDVGTLAEVEAAGERFYDGGVQGDALEIMADSGANLVRLRLWNNPYSSSGQPYGGGTNDLAKTIALAKRAKALGMDVLLDLHYSDFWADPGKQIKPKAWANMSYSQLTTAVRTYSRDVVSQMTAAGAKPDIVQVGNEITNGMLQPTGSTSNWTQLGGLLKAGIAGVHEGGSGIEIALHLDRGGNNSAYRTWFDNARNQGVPYDIIAMSYYPYWHGTMNQLRTNMNDVAARYGKDVMVVETAYAWTLADGDGRGNIFTSSHAQESGYPATVAGQTQFLRDLQDAIADVPNDRGRGLVWWEAAWTGDLGQARGHDLHQRPGRGEQLLGQPDPVRPQREQAVDTGLLRRGHRRRRSGHRERGDQSGLRVRQRQNRDRLEQQHEHRRGLPGDAREHPPGHRQVHALEEHRVHRLDLPVAERSERDVHAHGLGHERRRSERRAHVRQGIRRDRAPGQPAGGLAMDAGVDHRRPGHQRADRDRVLLERERRQLDQLRFGEPHPHRLRREGGRPRTRAASLEAAARQWNSSGG
jgi:arabinogalactan endo-1,4-beta-galactosidase